MLFLENKWFGAYGAPNKAYTYLLPLIQWRLLAVAGVMKIGGFDFPAKVVSLRGDWVPRTGR
jgi:hypothetical protein